MPAGGQLHQVQKCQRACHRPDGPRRALQDTRGNSKADAAVHRGYASCSNSRRALAELYEERANAYAGLVVSIQRLTPDILTATRRRRARCWAASCMALAARGGLPESRGLALLVPKMGGASVRLPLACLGARGLAARSGWPPAPSTLSRSNGSNGARVSWLELLLDFELAAGSAVRSTDQLRSDTARVLRRESEVKELLNMFQHEATRAVAVLYTRDAARPFKTAKGGRARLPGLCINTGVACLQTWPCWDTPRRVVALVAMLLQRGVAADRAVPGITDETLLPPRVD